MTSLQTSIILVNETYPSECIQFRLVLNPLQLRFRVDGISTTEKEQSPVAEPPDSLPLKPSRREKYLSPDRHQSSIEEPPLSHLPRDPPNVIPETIPSVSNAIVKCANEAATEEMAPARTWKRDALDDMIEEAKATSHLVRTLLFS